MKLDKITPLCIKAEISTCCELGETILWCFKKLWRLHLKFNIFAVLAGCPKASTCLRLIKAVVEIWHTEERFWALDLAITSRDCYDRSTRVLGGLYLIMRGDSTVGITLSVFRDTVVPFAILTVLGNWINRLLGNRVEQGLACLLVCIILKPHIIVLVFFLAE